MPELPEVSYFKKYLDATALHQKIRKVSAPEELILGTKEVAFQQLQGDQLKESRRVGKYLFVATENRNTLIFHFGMTGNFEYRQGEEPPKYTYFTLHFENDFQLFFTCPRKLARVYLVEDAEVFRKEHELGQDALEASEEEFLELADGRRGSMKGFLMNQKIISGIGNLYSDEILFQSRIHPATAVNDLNQKELKAIFRNIEKVLLRVTKSKMDGSSLPRSYITPYRKAGAPCPRGNGKIKKAKIAGRTSYFCVNCQPTK
ncbi:MAG: DNA-formamidopyrimidine glycosylase family protein [Christiangramia sp.]|uniref:Fpg/Nei family DNA glycosylase n=1 Tax=Christiangramia sp. TaxID=1931228 RepID=UPI003241E964